MRLLFQLSQLFLKLETSIELSKWEIHGMK